MQLSRLAFIFLVVTPLSAKPVDQVPSYDSVAIVTSYDAGAPLNRILMIRKGAAVCLITFRKAWRERNPSGQTLFDSGDDSEYAEYEWRYQVDGSMNFTNAHVIGGKGKVSRLPLKGIGRFAFQFGNTEVRCGPLRFRWVYPGRVSFGERIGYPDEPPVTIAPTGWTLVTQVTVHDARLKWYSFEEVEKILYVPTSQLPGA